MTVPEIEIMNEETVNNKVDEVALNMDLMTKVETREELTPGAHTKIHVTFSYLKRVKA